MQDVPDEANTTLISKKLMESPLKTTIEFFHPRMADALFAKAVHLNDTLQLIITITTGPYEGCFALVAIQDWQDSWILLPISDEQLDT